ncbi:MAG: LPXTG cell wall anchor domain-containing protein [Planctomycetes bacterium]|nr:LPXTG cell wall anchor domain-containing protein [Planctomycetota bacterium]
MTARAPLWSLALLALAACDRAVPPWREPPTAPLDLRVHVQPTSVQLLEPVAVVVDLWRRRELTVEFAPDVDRAAFLVERTHEPERPFGDGVWQRTTFVLRPIRGPGDVVLPPFRAEASDGSATATTPEQTLTVTTSLAADADPAIEAPGAPFPPPPRTALWLALAGLALLLGGLGFFALKRRRVRPHPVAVAQPPHVKALRALERLRAAPRATAAEVEAFYVDVSLVLRTYLEERFSLRAPERTTEEFLRELETGDQLAREHRRELAQFLSACDLVKFAAARPGEAEHLATFALAQAFVASTAGDRQPAGASA